MKRGVAFALFFVISAAIGLVSCGFEWNPGDDCAGGCRTVVPMNTEDSLDLLAFAAASGFQLDPRSMGITDSEGRIISLGFNRGGGKLVFRSPFRLPKLKSVSISGVDTSIWLMPRRNFQTIRMNFDGGLGAYQWVIDGVDTVATLNVIGVLIRTNSGYRFADSARELELISKIRVSEYLWIGNFELRSVPEWLYRSPGTMKLDVSGSYLCSVPDSARQFLNARSPGWEDHQSCRTCPNGARIPWPDSCP